MVETTTDVAYENIISYLILTITIMVLYWYDKKYKTQYLVNVMLLFLWVLSIGFVLYVYGVIGIQNASSSAPFGIILAALLASTSMMKNIAETKTNEIRKHEKEDSKFHLDRCTEGLKTFYELLENGNNNRAIWLEASRTILTVLKLSEKITEPHHQDFFDLEKSKYRHKLYTVYQEVFNGHEVNGHLFFSGEKNWDCTYNTLEELLENPYHIEDIDQDSLIAVFSFLDYPKDYKDPLDEEIYSSYFSERKWVTEPQKYAAKYLKICNLEKEQQ